MVSAPGVGSEDLVVRAQNGEAEAFTALVDAYHPELVRVAYVVAGDFDVALDAVQTAWIVAWRKLPTLRDRGRIRPWLVAIAANEARQAARARRRRSIREVAIGGPEPIGAAPMAERVDIERALARLDPEDRQLLAMRYLAGLSSDEIATVTGRSASGVRTRLFRLISRLRKDLADG